MRILRRLKDQVGDFTAFVSVEPIVAPCDQLDFTGVDWVLTGGESGPKARPMEFAWLEQANEKALGAGIPLHFKQFGKPINNPWCSTSSLRPQSRLARHEALAAAVAHKQELAPDEKGGATYKGRVIREKPRHWHRLKAELKEGFDAGQ